MHSASIVTRGRTLLCACTLLALAAPLGATCVLGDIAPRGNPDGLVNVSDVVVSLRLAIGAVQPLAGDWECGDIGPGTTFDGTQRPKVYTPEPDGIFNISDVVVALRAAVGGIQIQGNVEKAAVLDAQGGTVQIGGLELPGLAIQFPPGSLDGPTNIVASHVKLLKTSAGEIGFARIGPEGLEMDPPAVLRIPAAWDDAFGPNGRLAVYTYSPAAGAAWGGGSEASIAQRLRYLGKTGGRYEYEIPHLSSFFFMEVESIHLVLDLPPERLEAADLMYCLTRTPGPLGDFDWNPGHASLLSLPGQGTLVESSAVGPAPSCSEVGVRTVSWEATVGPRTFTGGGLHGLQEGHLYMGARRPPDWMCGGDPTCEALRRGAAIDFAGDNMGGSYSMTGEWEDFLVCSTLTPEPLCADEAIWSSDDRDANCFGCDCFSSVGLTEAAYRKASVPLITLQEPARISPLIPLAQFKAAGPVEDVNLRPDETLVFSLRAVVAADEATGGYSDDPALSVISVASWTGAQPTYNFGTDAFGNRIFEWTSSEQDAGNMVTVVFQAEGVPAGGPATTSRTLRIHVVTPDFCHDRDSDGYGLPGVPECPNGPQEDCDDLDPAIHPGALEVCDDADNNCNGSVDDMLDPDTCRGTCEIFLGYRWTGGGGGLNCCGDDTGEAGPYEVLEASCIDGRDNDCDALIDQSDPDCLNACIDRDGDGYGDPGRASCPGGSETDCDDFDPGVNPGNPTETNCTNGKDDDCDGLTDMADPDCGVACNDQDGDGYGNPGRPTCPNGAEDDCDDTDPAVHPGNATEANCSNGKDDDCDGLTDDADPDCALPCSDQDGDGYGSPGSLLCPNGPQDDCDDSDPAVNPGMAPEAECSNGKDDDCDGKTDLDDQDCIPPCIDLDGDGYGSPGSIGCPNGSEEDCDNSDPAINPGNPTETSCTNGKDEDCDGLTDGDDPDCAIPCTDQDGDGYGSPGSPNCSNGPAEDCDDSDPAVNPGNLVEAECENGKDDDCDGLTDGNDPDCFPPCIDQDGDGYGDPGAPECLWGDKQDCDDGDPTVHPGNPREAFCDNGKDDDCDGLIDVEDWDCYSLCIDLDGDGYGSPGGDGCPNGSFLEDCDDEDPDIRPGIFGEADCDDGKDNDCSGEADSDDFSCRNPDCFDTDGDGYGSYGRPDCPKPGRDCHEGRPNWNPGADENCEDDFDIDEDCDRLANDNDPECWLGGADTWVRVFAEPVAMDPGAWVNPASSVLLPDDGILAAGVWWYHDWQQSGATARYVWLMRLDSRGGIQWTRTYGYADPRHRYGEQVIRMADGDYLILGDGSLYPKPPEDAWLMNVDPVGNILWQKALFGPAPGDTYPDSITRAALASDGGLFLVGKAECQQDTCSGGPWVLNLDSGGSIQWQRTYGKSFYNPTIVATDDGGAIVAGGGYSHAARSGGHRILKLDASGDVLSDRLYMMSDLWNASEISLLPDGRILLAGTLGDVGTRKTGYLILMSPTGEVVLHSYYTGAGAEDVHLLEAIPARQGGYLVTGIAGERPLLIELLASGSPSWAKTYGTEHDHVEGPFHQTADGHIIVTLNSASMYPVHPHGPAVMRLDEDGSIGGSCDFVQDFTVTQSDLTVTVESVASEVTNTSASFVSTSVQSRVLPLSAWEYCADR